MLYYYYYYNSGFIEWTVCCQSVKKIAASIDKLKAELSTSNSSKLSAAAASISGSQVPGSKVAGSTMGRHIKLVRTPSVTASSEVTPSVTSSTADVTSADDKPTEASSPLDQVLFAWYFTCDENLLVSDYLPIFNILKTNLIVSWRFDAVGRFKSQLVDLGGPGVARGSCRKLCELDKN